MTNLIPMVLRDIEPILGASNIFGVDQDDDSLSILMMGHYVLGISPMHPSEGERPSPGVDNYDDSREVPYEYWKAAIEALEAKYKEAAKLIAQKMPEYEVTIGYSFEGPAAPRDLTGQRSGCFKGVPSSFELKLKTD